MEKYLKGKVREWDGTEHDVVAIVHPLIILGVQVTKAEVREHSRVDLIYLDPFEVQNVRWGYLKRILIS